ncbi:MAG: tetratricopeptide repeat protein [Acidobacteria bacterium]|nr:tetratricopeptide repeat protein [Acidobacteriota bacterium]MBV9478440.1 tetratricopeptide repeat protein [Acidobacteriota bacterium]
MDRQHRYDLKHDRFVDEIGALSSKARANQRLLLTIAAGAVLIALVAFGVYFYRSTREDNAQQALAEAIDTIEAPVDQPGQPAPKTGPHFKTNEERNAAAEKLFKDVQAKYSGTNAADLAELFLARITVARGDSAGGRKMLESFIDDHKKSILVGGARYSLYQLRIDNGEAAQVTVELNAEMAKADPVLPGDSILSLLAHAYEVQGNPAKEREAYRRIANEFPDSPYAVDAQRRAGMGPA